MDTETTVSRYVTEKTTIQVSKFSFDLFPGTRIKKNYLTWIIYFCEIWNKIE